MKRTVLTQRESLKIMSKNSPGSVPRIVLIEDNPNDVFFLRNALDELGEKYQLDVLRDGEQALKFIDDYRTNFREPEPCVIVLDLHLPKLDGITVLKAIRRDSLLAHVRVAVVTTIASPQDEAQLIDFDVSLFRMKPTQLDEFSKLAEEILALCRADSLNAVS
jgi:chemotaxis family two-component system response regulator Rcp1